MDINILEFAYFQTMVQTIFPRSNDRFDYFIVIIYLNNYIFNLFK